jgi:hypothetical protein
VGAVHDLDDFAVDVSGQYTGFGPFFIQGCWRPFEVVEFAFGLAPFVQGFFGHFQGDFIDVAVLDGTVNIYRGGHVKPRSDSQQLVGIFDFVSIGLFASRAQEYLGHAAAVVGVGGCAAGDHADEVAGRDGVGRGAAKALAGVFTLDAALGQGQAAGAHGAVFTTDALETDRAGFHLD